MMWAAKGIRLQIRLGPRDPQPAPAWLVDSLDELLVTHDSDQRQQEFSGFQLRFKAGRARLAQDQLVSTDLLKPMSRVILIVFLDYQPTVLMDGVITEQDYQPNDDPGNSVLTVKGQDVSYVLSLEERNEPHTGESVLQTVQAILGRGEYAEFGLVPKVDPATPASPPSPNGYVPIQHGSDFCHLRQLARQLHYAFYLVPGPAPGSSRAYFGPALLKDGPAQPPLNVNLGPYTNTQGVSFRFDGTAPMVVKGHLQDSESHDQQIVESQVPSPIFSKEVGVARNRVVLPCNADGLTGRDANRQAQLRTDEAFGRTLRVTGEVDALRYGAMLQARRPVELRGVGKSYAGSYYVKKVTHVIKVGQYRQRFELQRPGQEGGR